MCLPQALQPLPSFPGHACLTRFSSPFASCAGKASKEAGSSSGPESQFIRGVIALHDKYIEYVQASRLPDWQQLGVLAGPADCVAGLLAAMQWDLALCAVGASCPRLPTRQNPRHSLTLAAGSLWQLLAVPHGHRPVLHKLTIVPSATCWPAGLIWQLLAVPQGAQGRV